ncbi:DUF3489 domain-containing protein [Brevundimonas sp.]|uniref:DUF3489 domain-containing protein n=1 Tax=Brevundimonas sp. TaxID=1871086 RepID=UPI0028A99D20|nr:DUF3489 domain-containing protein [Brevundimonas sp.]
MNQNNVQPAGEAASQPARVSKISQVVALLRRPEGATAAQIMEATGWQAHSVRGAIAGQIRKKLSLTVATEKVEGLTVYRITAAR